MKDIQILVGLDEENDKKFIDVNENIIIVGCPGSRRASIFRNSIRYLLSIYNRANVEVNVLQFWGSVNLQSENLM